MNGDVIHTFKVKNREFKVRLFKILPDVIFNVTENDKYIVNIKMGWFNYLRKDEVQATTVENVDDALMSSIEDVVRSLIKVHNF